MNESTLPRAGALGVVLLLACLVPAAFWGGGLEAFESAKTSLALLGGIALVSLGVLTWRSPPRDPVTLAVGASFLAAFVATLFSVAPRLSLLGCHECHHGLLTLAALAATYLATRAAVQSRPHAEALVAGLAVACALAAGYALVQTVGLDPIRWDARSGYAGWIRPSGTEGHPMKLAGLLAMALPLIAWRGKRIGTLLCLACLAVIVACLSRGAWLAVATGLSVWFLLRPGAVRLPWRWLLGGAVALGLIVFLTGLAGPLGQRLLGIGEGRTRLLIWQSCWQLFVDRPLVGWGPDTLQLVFGTRRLPEYWILEWGRIPSRAHNEILHVLATQGLLGGLAYAALLAALARAALVAWQRSPQERGLVAALASCIVAHQTALLTGFSMVGSAIPFAIAAGLLARLSIGPLEDGPGLAGARFLLPAGAMAGWLLLVANALLFAARPLGAIDWLTLTGLAVLPILAAAAYRPARQPGSPVVDFPGWLSLPLAASACLAAWVFVACPLVAWGLCRRAELHPTASPAQRMAWLEEATRWAPERGEVWERLAAGAQDAATKGDHPATRLRQAVAAAEMCCRLVPASSEAHANRGKTLLELARSGLADVKQVNRAYERAVRLDPTNAVHMRDAARACLALGATERAERWIVRADAAGARHGSIGAERAALRLARGDVAGAEEAVTKALKKAPWDGDTEGINRARGILCLVRLSQGGFQDALVVSGLIEQDEPDWPIAPCIQGMALERLGRVEQAKAAYRRALGLAPGYPQARAGLARLRASN